METNILKTLNDIFISVFKDKTLKINLDTKQTDIPLWDSLNNIVLISEIEKIFNVKFSLDDIYELKSVQDIVNIIKRKK